MAEQASEPIFREFQRFRDVRWLRLLLLGQTVVTLGIVACLAGWLLRSQPMCSRVVTPLAILCGAAVLVEAITIGLFRQSALTIEVRADGVHFRFSPFHRKFRSIPLDSIATAEAVTYRPIVEYGGWGLRYGRGGRAYNISGNRGVRLTFVEPTSRWGKTLLLGSQRADELAAAIAAAQRS